MNEHIITIQDNLDQLQKKIVSLQERAERAESAQKELDLECYKLEKELESAAGGFHMSWKDDYQIAPNFRISEFFSKDGYPLTVVENKLVNKLQQLRNHFNKPIILTSGYRSVAHNNSAKVGGSPDSYHQRGMAADIHIPGVSLIDLAKAAEKIGFSGIDIYDTFVHVDTRPSKWRGPGWVRQIGG